MDTGLTPATDTSRASVYNTSENTSLKINTPRLHFFLATWNPLLPVAKLIAYAHRP